MDPYENGIAERRIADDTIDTSYMAVEASKKHLKMQELAERISILF